MKALRMLTRSIRDAFKSVVRNFSLSLASISCITITLIIVALAIIASFNVDNFTKEIEKDMTIVVFMDNESTDDDIKDAETRIKKLSNVEKYTYQSKVDVKEQSPLYFLSQTKKLTLPVEDVGKTSFPFIKFTIERMWLSFAISFLNVVNSRLPPANHLEGVIKEIQEGLSSFAIPTNK